MVRRYVKYDIKYVNHIVIEELNDYTLLRRDTDFMPYVVAYKYNNEDGSWASGHYFSTIIEAVLFIAEREDELRVLSYAINILDKNEYGSLGNEIMDVIGNINGE